jgi:hypothetical protein
VNEADHRAENLLRQGLSALAAEAGEQPLQIESLKAGAVAGAHRIRTRRRAAGAVLTALAVAVIFLVDQTPWRAGAEAPPAGPPRFFVPPTEPVTTPTPALRAAPPLLPRQPTPSQPPRSTPSGTGRRSASHPMRVTLTVDSAAASADGTVFVARWTITWKGGDAPADMVLLTDPTGVRARATLAVSCRGSNRSGTVSGQVDFADPGPHALTAVVRVHRCDGSLQRTTDGVKWTWSGPSSAAPTISATP